MSVVRATLRPGAAAFLALIMMGALAALPVSARGQAAAPDTATLVVSNRPVITFRAALGASTPRDRVAAAAARIAAIDQRGNVEIRAIPEGHMFLVDDRPLFAVLVADIDTLSGESVPVVLSATAARLERAIDAGIEQRSVRHLVRGLVFSVLATAALIIGLRLLRVSRRWLEYYVLRGGRKRLPRLAIGDYQILAADRLVDFGRRLIELVAWGLALFGSYLWLTFVLTRFAYTRPWGEALGRYLTNTLANLGLGVLHAIPGLFTIVIIFVGTRFLGRLIGSFFDAVQADRVTLPWLHSDIVQPTRRIVLVVLWLFAIVVAYPYLPGSDSEIFKGVSVFAGLIITLGSTGVVGQAMSGMVLMYARALRPGDYVRIADTEGVVLELGALATKIRNTKNEIITIPNAVVVNSSTRNFSRAPEESQLLIYTSVTIGYDTPWRTVHQLLMKAAAQTDGLAAEPAPFVLQKALSDFYVEYQVNAALLAPEQRIRALSVLHQNIQDAFNEAGVQIMSPHYRAMQTETPIIGPAERHAPAGSE